MGVQQVLGIFRQKTAPAFEVALRLGAAYAGADADVHEVLARYSDSLGVAYQIRDDLDDLAEETRAGARVKPTLPLAEAHDRAKGADKELMQRIWASAEVSPEDAERLQALIGQFGIAQRGEQLLASYQEAAIRSLQDIHNPSLKGLLRRLIAKIFRVEIQGWCSEFEARNAASSEAVA